MGSGLSRGLATASVLAALGAGATFAACGIDENGTMSNDDGAVGVDVSLGDSGGGKDVVIGDGPPVLSCEEAGIALDASCLGQPIPAGWTPIGFQAGVNVGCSADFTPYPLVTNPQVPPGACNCTGCAPTSGWTCGVTLESGNQCSEATKDGGASFCWNNINHQSFGEALTRYGTATCGGGQQVGFQDASATPLSVCVPKSCSTDYCALGSQGFKLCVFNGAQSDGGCPTTFPHGQLVAQNAAVACDACQQCTLTNPNATCTGSVTAYNGNNCDNNVLGSTSTNNQCATASGNYNSLYFDAGPAPTPNCGAPTGTATGVASLVAPGTICCTQ